MSKATEIMSKLNTAHGNARRGSVSKEYRSYAAMKGRILNPANKEYARYGGRGIAICREWLGSTGFENFLRDMGAAPSERHSLDRVNTESDYGPENCRWALPVDQVRNRRNTLKDADGTPLGAISAETGIALHTLRSRLMRGLTGARLRELPTTGMRKPTVERRS